MANWRCDAQILCHAIPHNHSPPTFIKLTPFFRAREAYGTDDAELAQLQPPMFADTDGRREPRFRRLPRTALTCTGTSGHRVICFLRNAEDLIVLVLLHAKNVRENIELELLRGLKERFGP